MESFNEFLTEAFRYTGTGSTAILPAGKILFNKNKCKLSDTWEEWEDGTMETWYYKKEDRKNPITGPLKDTYIHIHGGSTMKVGSTAKFKHDQTGRTLFDGIELKLVGIVKYKDKKITETSGEKLYDKAFPLYVYK